MTMMTRMCDRQITCIAKSVSTAESQSTRTNSLATLPSSSLHCPVSCRDFSSFFSIHWAPECIL